jgi:uncharacterized protein YbcC (UPF0753/DUF2309 family)
MTNFKTINTSISDSDREELTLVIDKIGHYLPSQEPISNFVHHNTLHQFEDYEFFEGIEKAAKIYSASAYFSEQEYQEEYTKGRISQSDLNRILGEQNIDGTTWLFGLSKRKFYRSLLLSSPPPITPHTLRWRLKEKAQLHNYLPFISLAKKNRLLTQDKSNLSFELLNKASTFFAPPDASWDVPWPTDILKTLKETDIDSIRNKWKDAHSLALQWIYCCHFAEEIGKDISKSLKNSDLESIGGFFSNTKRKLTQADELINPYLIKFTSCFLDAGLSHLSVADREQGLFKAFISHMNLGKYSRAPWLEGDFLNFSSVSSLEVIYDYLSRNKIEKSEWKNVLLKKALILKGWGGLIYRTEIGASGLNAKATLADFLAIRLTLEQNANNYLDQHLDEKILSDSEEDNLIAGEYDKVSYKVSLAYHLFCTFQIFGISASELFLQGVEAKEQFKLAIKEFTVIRRLRIWQSAYEWNLYSRGLSAILSVNSKTAKIPRPSKCQIVCCIDDREESFRRYIEEISDEYETFGTAGFFGIDAEFHNLYERPAPFCPVNVIPTHQIKVIAKGGSEEKISGIGRLKQIHSDIEVLVESQSRSLFRGWLLALGGILALFPLSIAIISPRFTHLLKEFLNKSLVNPNEESALVYSQSDSKEETQGFTLEEMSYRVKTLLTTTGLSKELAPLIIIMGHGSFSVNNPYRSAYDCGACGGRPGRLNPRAFTSMANRKDVRKFLFENGFEIPESTYFVGAFHNTTTDGVEYFDQSIIPDSHQKLFLRAKQDIEVARSKNALERCRKFDEVKIRTEAEAIAHVESRAHHIAQPRPEYGHATNAFCFVGRRKYTRNIFLDRRSFLVSYDKTIDPELNSIKNLLKAIVPVCLGINLEYFFSKIDNQNYGAGSKLPHNVTSLLGLMTGYCSDLRTGLPAQMIEIHEAVRLLIIIDLEPEVLINIFNEEKEIYRPIKNKWVRLASYKAETNEMFIFNDANEFEKINELALAPLEVKSSLAWAIGKKDHLDFVEISS